MALANQIVAGVLAATSSATCAASPGRRALARNGTRHASLLGRKLSSTVSRGLLLQGLLSMQPKSLVRPTTCASATTVTTRSGSGQTAAELVRSVRGRQICSPWCATSAGYGSAIAACRTGCELRVSWPISASCSEACKMVRGSCCCLKTLDWVPRCVLERRLH
jgi:hypothetical protein